MTKLLTHKFVSTWPTGRQVEAQTDWDEDHVFTGGTAGDVLIRDPTVPTFGSSWQPKAMLDVRDYGAVGDGVTDGTLAIQAAITALYSTITGTGCTGWLWIPRGIYLVSATIVFKNDILTGSGGAVVCGAGMGATVLKLANSANVPVIDLGGATQAEQLVTMTLQHLQIDGNKANQASATAHGIRARWVDRCTLRNILIVNAKGVGLSLDKVSLLADAVEVFSSGSHGIEIIDSTSIALTNGYSNNNGGWGLYAHYDGTGLVAAQSETSALITGNHFEQNTLGEVWLKDWDNAVVSDNTVNATAAVTPIIQLTGGCRWNRLLGNFSDQANDSATYDDGSGTSGNIQWLAFGRDTYENVHGNNPNRGATVVIGGNTVRVPMEPRVVDLGRNYTLDPYDLVIRQIHGTGGHSHAGWTDRNASLTNLLIQSEDLSNAAWTAVQITSRTYGTTYGNPFASGGSSTEIVVTATQVGTVDQVGTVAVSAGDLYTFSVYLRVLGAGSVNDVRLELLDTSNVLLARQIARIDDQWRRYAVSVRAVTGYTNLKCRISKPSYGVSAGYVAWGAQLNAGDVGPYLPTLATVQTMTPGFAAMSLRTTRDGTAGAPALAIGGEQSLGFYRPSDGNLGAVFSNYMTLHKTNGQGIGTLSYNYGGAAAVGGTLGFADASGGTDDVFLARITANTFGQQSGNADQFWRHYAMNGGYWERGSASELLTLSTSGVTTDTTANLLPANSIIEAVTARVTTTITTATDWKLGDATITGRFAAANATMTAGATSIGLVHVDQTGTSGPKQVAAAKLRVTTTGTPGAGVIRITVFYRTFVAPTS